LERINFSVKKILSLLKVCDDTKHDCLGKHLALTNKFTAVQIPNIEHFISQKRGKIYCCLHVWMYAFPRWCRCLYRITCTVPPQPELYVHHTSIWNVILLYGWTAIPRVCLYRLPV
jgi:hypothetical protein